MSDQAPTPDTDAEEFYANADGGERIEVVDPGFARRLERERDEATKIAATANTEAVRYMKERDEARAEVARLREDNLRLAAIAAVPSTDREWRAERANDTLKAEVARLREDVLRWFAYIDPFELVDDDRKHFERWREEQARAAVRGEKEGK